MGQVKLIQLPDPAYGQTILLVANCSQKEFVQTINQRLGVEVDYHAGTYGRALHIVRDHTEQSVFLVWLSHFDGSSQALGMLAHELLHTTFNVLDSLGFTHSDESEEAYTYFLDGLMCAAIEALRKEKRGKKSKNKRA